MGMHTRCNEWHDSLASPSGYGMWYGIPMTDATRILRLIRNIRPSEMSKVSTRRTYFMGSNGYWRIKI